MEKFSSIRYRRCSNAIQYDRNSELDFVQQAYKVAREKMKNSGYNCIETIQWIVDNYPDYLQKYCIQILKMVPIEAINNEM